MRMYLYYEFNGKCNGLYCKCKATKGYNVFDEDLVYAESQQTEAMKDIMRIVKEHEEFMITFGDDLMMEYGDGHHYGRLLRYWCGSDLSYVTWDRRSDGRYDIAEKYDGDGSITDGRLTKKFFHMMMEAYQNDHMAAVLETEAAS